MPVSVQEFSAKIKQKYPEYQNVDDLTLAKKIVEKYPEYSGKVDFGVPTTIASASSQTPQFKGVSGKTGGQVSVESQPNFMDIIRRNQQRNFVEPVEKAVGSIFQPEPQKLSPEQQTGMQTKIVQQLKDKGFSLTPEQEQKLNTATPEELNDISQQVGDIDVNPIIGLGTGALKGVGSTIMNIGRAGYENVVAPALSAVGVPMQKPQEAEDVFQKQIKPALEPKGLSESLGFGAEQVGEFLIPGGAVSKVGKVKEGASIGSKLLGLGKKAAAEGAVAAGVTALQEGELNEDVKTAGLLGAAFPIGGKILKGLGKAGSEVAKYFSSTLSGVPKEAIEQALRNPKAVQTAIQKAVQEGGEVTAQRILKQAKDSLKTLKDARSQAYQEGLEKLEKKIMQTKNGKLYIKNTEGVFEPTTLTTSGLKKTTTRTLREFGASAKGTTLDFSEMAIDKAHGNKLQEVVNRIYDWKNTSPTGMNKLRQIIDSYKLGGINLGSSEKQFNAVIGKLRTNLSNYVGTRIPQIGRLNRQYASQSEVINNALKQLKLETRDPNTALRKLLNVFNPKSQVYRPIVEELGEKAGTDLMSDIAGLMMSNWTPEGLGKYLTTAFGGLSAGFAPAALVGLPAASPKIVGKVATEFGKVSQMAEKVKIPNIIKNLPKAAIIQSSNE